LDPLNTQIFIFKAKKTHKRAKEVCSMRYTGLFLVYSNDRCRDTASRDEGKKKEVLQQELNMRRP
jgi:hypothetical protein